jgi:NAD(P)-dependent dehydrogenase (short-subunit alcohol dehydrogenase family)
MNLEPMAAIILNASIVSIKGTPALSVYSATKAAVPSFARTWTQDLKDSKIRVNAVSPGHIDTPGLNGLGANAEQTAQFKSATVSGLPMGRLGTSDEIAKAVSFLASPATNVTNPPPARAPLNPISKFNF